MEEFTYKSYKKIVLLKINSKLSTNILRNDYYWKNNKHIMYVDSILILNLIQYKKDAINGFIKSINKNKKPKEYKSKILCDFFYKEEIIAFSDYCCNELSRNDFCSKELEQHYEDFFSKYNKIK